MSFESLNQTHPDWHIRPPAGLSRPFIRPGAIAFDTATPNPPTNQDQVICTYSVLSSEFLVIHSMEVQASALVGGFFQRLAPETAHEKLLWRLDVSSSTGELMQITGTSREAVQHGGIGLFGIFSYGNGTLAPVIAPPGSKVSLVVVQYNPAAGPVIPVGSKISGVLTGYRIIRTDAEVRTPPKSVKAPSYQSPFDIVPLHLAPGEVPKGPIPKGSRILPPKGMRIDRRPHS